FALKVYVLPLGVATEALPDAALGFAYEAVPAVAPAGGGPPYLWAVLPSAAALPPGLSIEPGTGRIAGKATAVGLFPFRLETADVTGQAASRNLSIRVNAGPVLDGASPASLPHAGAAVTLAGRGFRPGMTVAFGSALPLAADVSLADDTRAAVVPPRTPVQSGYVDVTVKNPDGGAYTRPKAFRYALATVAFAPAGVVGTARDHARGLAAGDVNRDGLDDLVHVGSSG